MVMEGVAPGLSNAADSSIAYTPWKKRKPFIREGGNGIEKPDRMSRKYKKIIARLILSSSLAYSMLCIS